MKKIQRIAALLLAVVLVVVAGCSAGSSPKQALQDSMTKMIDVDSYSAKISFGFDELELPADASSEELMQYTMIANMLKNAKLNVNAVYQKEPMRTDMELSVVVSGMTITIPMILNEKKLYVKIPAIPMLNLPPTISDKFIEIDIEALAAQQESSASLDIAAQQKFGQELSAILLKHFDEKTYFSEVKAEDASLPEGLKVDRIVRFSVDESNYEKSVEMIVNKLLPELIDVLATNEAYLQSAQTTKEEVTQMKTDLETNKAEVLDVLKNNVKVIELSLIGGIKDKYLEYQAGKLNVMYTDKESGQSLKLGVHYDAQYSDINKAPKFENELPTDAVKFEELMQQLQMPTGL